MIWSSHSNSLWALKKLLVLLAFSVLLLVPAGAQSAFAQVPIPPDNPVNGDCTSNGTGGGPWSDSNTWDCVFSDVPAKRKQVIIQLGDTVTVNRDLNRASGDASAFIGNVFVFGTLEVPSPWTFKSDFMQISPGTVENDGNMIIAEFSNFNIFNNNCGSTLTIQQLITNAGGPRGPEGLNAGPFTNFGTFELGILFGPDNKFNNVSPFLNGGSLINVIESGPEQNFGDVPISTIPSICGPVGGELIPIDSTALLLAGAQANALWLIPAIVAAVGIGIVITRKF